ncbi:MAG: hypothetical protein H6713_28090 [Myxococcales bacterium]|nr:hypothetical protein [Myxococcales bacterium]
MLKAMYSTSSTPRSMQAPWWSRSQVVTIARSSSHFFDSFSTPSPRSTKLSACQGTRSSRP